MEIIYNLSYSLYSLKKDLPTDKKFAFVNQKINQSVYSHNMQKKTYNFTTVHS